MGRRRLVGRLALAHTTSHAASADGRIVMDGGPGVAVEDDTVIDLTAVSPSVQSVKSVDPLCFLERHFAHVSGVAQNGWKTETGSSRAA